MTDPLAKVHAMRRAAMKGRPAASKPSCWPCVHYRTLVSGESWCAWRSTHALTRCDGFETEPGHDEAERNAGL